MLILAFETSCDDTSIAVFRDTELLGMHTEFQIDTHAKTQGVVPEVAARLHANNIFIALDAALEKSGVKIEEIDVFACTSEPGLLPSLLVGKTVTKTLAHTYQKPLIWIDHIEAHMFANLIERSLEELKFPAVCLTVSGGHNEIYYWKSLFERELLGETQDDAAGEAFDKVAKAMGFGFPGGPIISQLASKYTGEYKGIFPVVLLDKESLNFSFSGLKSAVKREIDIRTQSQGVLTEEDKIEISFEFEQCVARILTEKLFRAVYKMQVSSLVLAGGVSANDFLKQMIAERAEKEGFSFIYPKKKVYSQDNAAMVGILAYYKMLYSC